MLFTQLEGGFQKIAYQDCWTCQLETGSLKPQWLETNSVFHQHYVEVELKNYARVSALAIEHFLKWNPSTSSR